jgi:hypothetical protein
MYVPKSTTHRMGACSAPAACGEAVTRLQAQWKYALRSRLRGRHVIGYTHPQQQQMGSAVWRRDARLKGGYPCHQHDAYAGAYLA